MMTLAAVARGAVQPCPGEEDDHGHLAAMLRLAGGAGRSSEFARILLNEAGSLGAALALDHMRLVRLGVPYSVGRNLAAIRSAHIAALRRVVGERPLIDGLDAALDYLHAAMAHLSHEVFRVLFLDSRRRLIRDEVIYSGSVSSCAAHPRQILIRAVDLAACNLVLVHNHPSGALEPSLDDMRITERMVIAAEAMEVRIEDHLIIGRGGHFSFRSAGLMRRFSAGFEPLPPK